LQGALQSVLGALDVKVTPSETFYKVKNGDSLEKIAKNHHTTIQALKVANQLSNDRIVVGQTLQIPLKI